MDSAGLTLSGDLDKPIKVAVSGEGGKAGFKTILEMREALHAAYGLVCDDSSDEEFKEIAGEIKFILNVYPYMAAAIHDELSYLGYCYYDNGGDLVRSVYE